MLQPTSLAAQIVFENSDLLIVDKPWGWLSVPSRIGRKDPRHCLGILLQEQRGEQIWPCNRLDVEVSRLIICSNTTL
jgi:23S rRNA-/tRNA-specific pseudouridylate synthase